MSLSRRYKSLFPAFIRERGEEYARLGRVTITRVEGGHVWAVVRGERDYDVGVMTTDYGLRHQCSCPAHLDYGNCKHVWAVLVAMEGSGGKAATARRVPWQNRLAMPETVRRTPIEWPAERQAMYVVMPHRGGRAELGLYYRDRKRNGEWTVLKEWRPRYAHLEQLPEAEDREALALLTGGFTGYADVRMYEDSSLERVFVLPPVLADLLLPRLAQRGRLQFKSEGGQMPVTLRWDGGEPYRVALDVGRGADCWQVAMTLRRAEETLSLKQAPALFEGGMMVAGDRLARVETGNLRPFVESMRHHPVVEVPVEETGELLAHLAENVPDLLDELPEELRFVRETPRCCPLLRVTSHPLQGLSADVLFDYAGRRIPYDEKGAGILLAEERRLLQRNEEQEAQALAQLPLMGFRREAYAYGARARLWSVAAARFPAAAKALVQQGWIVEAEGRAFRPAGAVKVRVSSGIDWFALDGRVDYGDTDVSLAEVLKALRQKEQFVRLGDGSLGLLPEEWLAKYAPLVAVGSEEEGELRFRRSQAGLLDALMTALPEASWDEAFGRVREKLTRFGGVAPAKQPAGFEGKLRPYQEEGLGWLQFLREYGFGGCLADDMGLGKTAQVLAYLEMRREEGAGPSLVVVPRSLVFNWMQEAARFTPKLRVLDYSGAQRGGLKIEDCDVVISTYGTLRKDVVHLREQMFDTVVLDEAQAIKNHNTEAAKAARLLRGEHRLAMSGTPIENHLGELWSLFEFLNPGLLGSARAFQGLAGKTAVEDPTARHLLAQALRPFILRRTKEQVARDLPPKTEQTVYCELEGQQKRLYHQLLDHYRASVLREVDQRGLAKSKMHVLEALLRLRQAACHPALVDQQQAKAGSAKFEVLLESLAEVVDEGHKVLVFSQFTSLLALLKPALDARGLVYEYLDGQTRDRQAAVERFQNDPACPLFLISLKAGGLGLNLTAAEYVYLLDPWWNPAVESQAIDRTHRIGQTRHVFAYRLVARNTVEEKILELQNRKRDLAAAIITEDNAVLRKLTREDLELLLS